MASVAGRSMDSARPTLCSNRASSGPSCPELGATRLFDQPHTVQTKFAGDVQMSCRQSCSSLADRNPGSGLLISNYGHGMNRRASSCYHPPNTVPIQMTLFCY